MIAKCEREISCLVCGKDDFWVNTSWIEKEDSGSYDEGYRKIELMCTECGHIMMFNKHRMEMYLIKYYKEHTK